MKDSDVAERDFGFRWVAVGPGRLALWHRPRLRGVPWLPRAGCDRVVTLLSEREGGREIGALVERAGLDWTWIPLPGGRPPTGAPAERVREAIRELSGRLDAGESVLLHCSAGIHRTGMVAYALLRHRGLGPDEALGRIEAMRPVTRAGLLPAHLAWGDAWVHG